MSQQAFRSVWSYLSRQRSEVVLLFGILASALYGSVHLLPAMFDRAERMLVNIEAKQTEQIQTLSEAYQADQTRDHELNEQLLREAFHKKGAVTHVPE